MINDSTQQMIGFCMSLVLVGLIMLISVWDSYCLIIAMRSDWTVSFFLSDWAKRFPLLILAIGIVIGHLIWPFNNHIER